MQPLSSAMTCLPAISLTSSSNTFPVTPLVTSAHRSCLKLLSTSLPQGFCTYCFLCLECTSFSYPHGFFSHFLTVSTPIFLISGVIKITIIKAVHIPTLLTPASPAYVFLHCLYSHMACVIYLLFVCSN